ncbi:unnamed protein product [Vitrella brassicaformis CCMP3155]|uniref:Uncharacterized protein n=2 Tax=Vitrella brassicaformis TaxID=1169539 RepID=A0A0G4ETA9_VITBC|nr:unnamed protein product [Vitrella brassicaformis CCMP3155]|eukprot:CEM01838.1 unnamed protein product [Vitrella brassicaformis CCMP3155]
MGLGLGKLTRGPSGYAPANMIRASGKTHFGLVHSPYGRIMTFMMAVGLLCSYDWSVTLFGAHEPRGLGKWLYGDDYLNRNDDRV